MSRKAWKAAKLEGIKKTTCFSKTLTVWGSQWGTLGTSGRLGPFRRPRGALLGPFLGNHDAVWSPLGQSSHHLGPRWAPLGPSWQHWFGHWSDLGDDRSGWRDEPEGLWGGCESQAAGCLALSTPSTLCVDTRGGGSKTRTASHCRPLPFWKRLCDEISNESATMIVDCVFP